MVLEQLSDGASRHLPTVDMDQGTRELAFILGLPLIDGVFATLLVTGAVSTFSQAITVALTIFTGAGAIAVLLANSESSEEAKRMVRKVSPYIIGGAVIVSLVAPVFESLFYIERLKIAAGLVLLLIAGKMVQISYAEKISPATVLVTGMVLSLQSPSNLSMTFSYVLPALATVTVALLALYGLASLRPENLNTYYLNVGSAAALVVISATLFGVSIPTDVATAMMLGALIVSLDPTSYLQSNSLNSSRRLNPLRKLNR